ncbi:MAG: hypothetical protein ACT4P7_05440 [Gemmatimonadaceae bacterium]
MDTNRLRENAAAFFRKRWELVVATLVLLIEETTVGWLRDAINWAWGLRDRSLGEGGVVVVAVYTVGFLWTTIDPIRVWRERQKTREGSPPRPLSLEELTDVRAIREIWRGDGENACAGSMQLLRWASSQLKQKGNRFASLVDDVASQLDSCKGRLGAALERPNEPLASVQAHLQEAVVAYVKCLCWLNRCGLQDHALIQTRGDLSQAQYAYWGKQHARFADKYTNLLKHPSFQHFKQHLEATNPYDVAFMDDHNELLILRNQPPD